MKKPSKIKCVTAKKAWFLPSGFAAITLFGVVYCASQAKADEINKSEEIDSLLESHETIHVRQAESTKNSWIIYYLKYIWQWICNLPLIFIDAHAPYKFIAFEIEAYRYQNDWDYCKTECIKWKDYNKLTLKEKKKLAKEYFSGKMIFTNFIEKYIDPLL